MRHFRSSSHFLPANDEVQIKVTPVAAEEVIDNATAAESSMSANVLDTTEDTNNSFITKIRSNVSRVISKLFSSSGQSDGRSVEENRKRKATPEKLSLATIKRSRLNVPVPDNEGTSRHLYCSTPTTKHQTSNSIKSSSNTSKRAQKQKRREHYFRAFNAKERPRRIVRGLPKLSAPDLIRFDIRSRAALAAAVERNKDAVKKCYENKEGESDEESFFTAPTVNYHSSGDDSDQGSVPATTSDFSANNEDKIRESDENSNITIPSSIANFEETQSDHRSSVGGNSSSYHCEFRSTEAKPFESDGSGRLTTFLGNSCYRQIQHARETSGDLFFGMYYERKKMLFANKNDQPSSLTGYRPASKSSIFGSTSSLSAPSGNFGGGGNSGCIRGLRSKSMLLRSPFYEGMTRYGGASAAPYSTAGESVFNLARSSRASSTSLPTARAQTGRPSTLSLRSQRIVKVQEECSGPLSEARKLAAAVKQSACSNRLEMRSWSSIDENIRRSSSNPYTRPVMPLNELVIPSVPQMLQLKRLQKTTETANESTERTIEDASPSKLPAIQVYGKQTSDTSVTVPMSALIPTVPRKQVTKIKTKISRGHSNTASVGEDLFAPAEQLELPNVPLPPFASIPKIDLSLDFGSCANENKTILGKGLQSTCCDETILNQTPQHTLKNQSDSSLPFMFAAPEVLGSVKNLAVANSISFRFAIPEMLYFEATNDLKNGNNTFGEPMSCKQSNWECSTCLIRNENVNLCIACSSPKPISRTSKTEMATSETTLSVTDKNFKSIIGLQSARWECPDCFVRNDSSQQRCVCCGAAKKENEKTIATFGTTEQRSPTIQGSSPTKTSSDDFKTLVMQQKSGTWECSTCLTRNNNHSEQCVCCNQLNPDSSMSAKSNSNLITAQSNSANCTNLNNENYNSTGICSIPNAPPFSSVVAAQKNNQKSVNEYDDRDTSFKPEASGMKVTQHPIVEPHSFPVSEFTIDVPSTTAADVDPSTNITFTYSSSTLIGTVEHQIQPTEPASLPTPTKAVTGGTKGFSSPYTMPSESDVVSFSPMEASEKSLISNAACIGTTISSTTFSNVTSKSTSSFNFHLNGNSGDIMMADEEPNGERNSIPLTSAATTNSTILAFPFASVMKNSYANETDVAFSEVGVVSQMQIPSLPTSLSTTKQSNAPAGLLFMQQDMQGMPQSSLVDNRMTSFPTAEIRTLESHQAFPSFNFGSQVPVSIQSQMLPPTSAISSTFGETALPAVMTGTDNRIVFGASNKTIETPGFSSDEIKPIPPSNNGGSFVFSATNVGNKRPSDNTLSDNMVDRSSHRVTPVPYEMPLSSHTTVSNSFASGKGASNTPGFQFGDPSLQNPFVPPAIGRGQQRQQQIVQRRLKLRATRRLHQR